MEQVLVLGFIVLMAIVLFNFILTLAIIRQLKNISEQGGAATQAVPLEPGESAPDFVAETLSGDQVTLSAYSGRQVAFIFVSPTCGPCRAALPQYEALLPQARQSDTEIVLVSIADLAATRTFVEQYDISIPTVVADRAANPFMADYNISSTPSYCLIDQQGKVLSSGRPNFQMGAWSELVKSWKEAARALPV